MKCDAIVPIHIQHSIAWLPIPATIHKIKLNKIFDFIQTIRLSASFRFYLFSLQMEIGDYVGDAQHGQTDETRKKPKNQKKKNWKRKKDEKFDRISYVRCELCAHFMLPRFACSDWCNALARVHFYTSASDSTVRARCSFHAYSGSFVIRIYFGNFQFDKVWWAFDFGHSERCVRQMKKKMMTKKQRKKSQRQPNFG